jgi:hypothetical protein
MRLLHSLSLSLPLSHSLSLSGVCPLLVCSELYGNQLTGAVPSLPFKQYTIGCCLNYGAHTNRFACPLPSGAADCKCSGQPGVACNKPE